MMDLILLVISANIFAIKKIQKAPVIFYNLNYFKNYYYIGVKTKSNSN